MTDKKIDRLLRQTLKQIHPDGELNKELQEKLWNKYEERESNMKKFGIKKVVIIAAVCCMLFSSAVIASTGIVKYSTGHGTPREFTNYGQLDKVREKIGLDFKAPEGFTNGYTFMEASIMHGEDMGENDVSLGKYEGISIRYQNSNDDGLFLSADPVRGVQNEARNPTESAIIGDIEVVYYLDTYKVVPPDYRPTEEDEERLANDENFMLSYGSDEVEESQISSCLWVQDGISYDLLNIHNAMGAEEMFAMAEEIINLE